MPRRNWPHRRLIIKSAVEYLLNDEFKDILAAGSVDGTNATPGPGSPRHVTDVETLMSVGSGALNFQAQATATFGDENIIYDNNGSDWARAAGLAAFFHVNVASGDRMYLGWIKDTGNPATLSEIEDNHVLYMTTSSDLLALKSGGVAGPHLAEWSTSTDYTLIFILRSTGIFLIADGGVFDNTLLGVIDAGSTANMRIESSVYLATGKHNFIRAAQLPTSVASIYPTPVVADDFTNPTTTIADSGAEGLDGTATRAGLPGLYFDGENSLLTLPHAALVSAGFNPQEFSMIVRGTMEPAAGWDDGVTKNLAWFQGTGGADYVRIWTGGAGKIWLALYTDSALRSLENSAMSGAGEFGVGMTVSESADSGNGEAKAFVNGSKIGVTDAIPVSWDGGLVNAVIGRHPTIGTQYWAGNANNIILTLNDVILSESDAEWLADPANTITATELDSRAGSGNWALIIGNETHTSDGAEQNGDTGDGANVAHIGPHSSIDGAGNCYHAPVRGASLWDADAAVFTSGTYSWTPYGTNIIANDANQLKITYVDNALGAYVYLREADDLSSDLTVGNYYKIGGDTKVGAGDSVDLVVYPGYVVTVKTVTETSMTAWSLAFRATNANGHYIRHNNMGAGEDIWHDNLYLEPIPRIEFYSYANTFATRVLDTLYVRAGITCASMELVGVVVADDLSNPTYALEGYYDNASQDVVVYEHGGAGEVLRVAAAHSAGAEIVLRVDPDGTVWVMYHGAYIGNFSKAAGTINEYTFMSTSNDNTMTYIEHRPSQYPGLARYAV